MGKRQLNILIDSGSSNNFIDVNTDTELNCVLEEATPWIITVADGGKTTSRLRYTQFKWLMQEETFVVDFRVLQPGGCDLILGANWMWEHGPITFNLKENKIIIWKDKKATQARDESYYSKMVG